MFIHYRKAMQGSSPARIGLKVGQAPRKSGQDLIWFVRVRNARTERDQEEAAYHNAIRWNSATSPS